MQPLPKRFFPFIFFAMVAALMSGAVSFVVSLINLGWGPSLVFAWLKAWALAFPIAYPVAMVVAPLCRRLALKMTGQSTGDSAN